MASHSSIVPATTPAGGATLFQNSGTINISGEPAMWLTIGAVGGGAFMWWLCNKPTRRRR